MTKQTIARVSELTGTSINYLVENYMPMGSFNAITGPSKSGKSMFALQLAFCISNGIPFLGHNCEKHDALIVDFDNSPSVISNRISELKLFYSLEDAEEPLVMSYAAKSASGTVSITDVIAEIRSSLDEFPDVKLIIFDSLPAWLDGDVNQGINVLNALKPLKKLCADTGACVSYISYSAKTLSGTADTASIANSIIGSSVQGYIVDNIYAIAPVTGKPTDCGVHAVGRSCYANRTDCEVSAATHYCFKRKDGDSASIDSK